MDDENKKHKNHIFPLVIINYDKFNITREGRINSRING